MRHTHLKQRRGWQVDGATFSMQVLLDARHLLFSLASPASTLVPAQSVEAVRRAREKLLQERAADISLDFWRAARPAADVANNDDKLNAAKMRAVVRPLSLRKDLVEYHLYLNRYRWTALRPPLRRRFLYASILYCGGHCLAKAVCVPLDKCK